MPSLIPVSIARGVVSSDATAPILPLTAYDQAVAALSSKPDVLVDAWWAGKRSAGYPVDRVAGAPYTKNASLNLATFLASDPVFAGKPSFNFSGSNVSGFERLNFTPSWTYAFVFNPFILGANSALVAGVGGGYGSSVVLFSGNITVSAVFGSSLLVAPNTNLTANAANIIIACGDSATRQIALYVNSKTPYLTAAGVGTWPASLATPLVSPFNNSISTPFNGSGAQFAHCNASLHHAVGGASRIMELLDAAAETYGITLVP